MLFLETVSVRPASRDAVGCNVHYIVGFAAPSDARPDSAIGPFQSSGRRRPRHGKRQARRIEPNPASGASARAIHYGLQFNPGRPRPARPGRSPTPLHTAGWTRNPPPSTPVRGCQSTDAYLSREAERRCFTVSSNCRPCGGDDVPSGSANEGVNQIDSIIAAFGPEGRSIVPHYIRILRAGVRSSSNEDGKFQCELLLDATPLQATFTPD